MWAGAASWAATFCCCSRSILLQFVCTVPIKRRWGVAMAYEDTRPDSARENGGLGEAPRDHDTPYLSAGERRLLEAGKAEHRETTATAKRALQARRFGRAGSDPADL